jgi:hypothetical protein
MIDLRQYRGLPVALLRLQLPQLRVETWPEVLRLSPRSSTLPKSGSVFVTVPETIRTSECMPSLNPHVLCEEPTNLEHEAGIEPANRCFADIHLTTWRFVQSWCAAQDSDLYALSGRGF